MSKLVLLFSFFFVFSLVAENKVSEDQKNWHKRYVKQKNIPKLEETKINTDKEPDLNEGFVDLYNKKDLPQWFSNLSL